MQSHLTSVLLVVVFGADSPSERCGKNLVFRHNQAMRVRGFRELSKRDCSSRSTSRSTSRNGGCRRRSNRSDQGALSNSITSLLRADMQETADARTGVKETDMDFAIGSVGDDLESLFIVETAEGPFCPAEIAAAVLKGGLGHFEETCGYSSHLVQIAQLLMEQKDSCGVVSITHFLVLHPKLGVQIRDASLRTCSGLAPCATAGRRVAVGMAGGR